MTKRRRCFRAPTASPTSWPSRRLLQAVADLSGLARRVGGGEGVGTAAALHRANRDRPAGAERRHLAANEVEIAHAIEVGVLRDAGRAIAGAKLGAQIEPDLAAAIGGLAG